MIDRTGSFDLACPGLAPLIAFVFLRLFWDGRRATPDELQMVGRDSTSPDNLMIRPLNPYSRGLRPTNIDPSHRHRATSYALRRDQGSTESLLPLIQWPCWDWRRRRLNLKAIWNEHLTASKWLTAAVEGFTVFQFRLCASSDRVPLVASSPVDAPAICFHRRQSNCRGLHNGIANSCWLPEVDQLGPQKKMRFLQRRSKYSRPTIHRSLSRGYGWQGAHHHPPFELAALYVDQFPGDQP